MRMRENQASASGKSEEAFIVTCSDRDEAIGVNCIVCGSRTDDIDCVGIDLPVTGEHVVAHAGCEVGLHEIQNSMGRLAVIGDVGEIILELTRNKMLAPEIHTDNIVRVLEPIVRKQRAVSEARGKWRFRMKPLLDAAEEVEQS